MKSKKSILILFAFSLILISCAKYDEGPGLSLRSKKARIVNTWVIESLTLNDVEYTGNGLQNLINSGFTPLETEATEDGKYIERYKTGEVYQGTWELIEDDKKMKIVYDNASGGGTEIATIVRLKEKSVWIDAEIDNVRNIVKYKPK